MRTRLKILKNKKLGKSCEILFDVYANKNNGKMILYKSCNLRLGKLTEILFGIQVNKNKAFMIFDVYHNLKDN